MKVDYFTIPEITVSYKDNVKTSERAVIGNSADAAKIFAAACKDYMQHHEEVYVMFLNRAGRVLGIFQAAKGGMAGATFDIKIILQTALKVSASAILLSHNHPSGNTKPSGQDISMTKALQKGCQALDIKLLDHVIITDETFTSFADSGLL